MESARWWVAVGTGATEEWEAVSGGRPKERTRGLPDNAAAFGLMCSPLPDGLHIDNLGQLS